MPLLSADQLRQLKPALVVRRPAQFRRAFLLWAGLFFAAFLLVHAWWSLRGFRGDQTLLPAILLLTGVGLILMVSLRDPVRDNLLFVDFAQGVAGGCAAAGRRRVARLRTPLREAELRAAAGQLRAFGAADPVRLRSRHERRQGQPVRLPAGGDRSACCWCSFWRDTSPRRWDVLRHARETRASVAALTRRFDIPPLEYTLPVLASVALSLAFFFLQKDMGPALVFACLFLALYGMARGSAFRARRRAGAGGRGLRGRVSGSACRTPCGERVAMWLSPWDNLVHGGDQLAHSLWAFATGGVSGMGIGLGDPQVVPAAHTDLILSALGEEWGFLGVAAVFALYALLVYRALAHRPAGAHRLRVLPGRRAGRGHRAPGPADLRRRAGRAAALRRGDAVPELRAHGHAGQLRW